MGILRENPTVLVALSVPLLHIQPMAFPVLFVAVDLAVQRKSYVHVLHSSLIFLGMFVVATYVQLHRIVPNKRHLAVLQPAHVHGSLPERLPLHVDAILLDESVTTLVSGVLTGMRALAVILGLDRRVQLVR
jgi:hypothetical protein